MIIFNKKKWSKILLHILFIASGIGAIQYICYHNRNILNNIQIDRCVNKQVLLCHFIKLDFREKLYMYDALELLKPYRNQYILIGMGYLHKANKTTLYLTHRTTNPIYYKNKTKPIKNKKKSFFLKVVRDKKT